MRRRRIAWILILVVALNSASLAQAQSRGPMLWTISGAGAGFGIGLWAGLSAFDDAVNSDRKVWTSAIVGAGVGAVAGYLIGRARTDRNRPSTTAPLINRERQEAIDPAADRLPDGALGPHLPGAGLGGRLRRFFADAHDRHRAGLKS